MIEYNYTHNENQIIKPSIIKEIYIMRIIDEIKKMFNNFLSNIITVYPELNTLLLKSSFKIDSLIQRWCWHQYNLPDSMHNVIPYVKSGNYDWYRFIEDLAYITQINTLKELKTSKELIKFNKKIHNYLTIEYNNLQKLNTNQKYDLIKNNITEETVNKINYIYKGIDDFDYELCITKKVYDRLKKKLLVKGKYDKIINYTCNIDYQFDEIIFCLCLRYNYLDSKNQQLAIIEEIKDMFKKIGFNFELFGSAINTVSDNYCSLFTDIEYFFGSCGNFFDIKIEQGLYWCNPPYDDSIMTQCSNNIVNWLENNNNLIFLITIPIWDKKTQKCIDTFNYSVIDNNKDIPDDEFNDFLAYKTIKPYIKKELIIPKNRIPYFNYKRNIHIYAVNTYLLLIHHPNIDKSYDNILTNINDVFTTININDTNNNYINRDNKIINSKKKLVNFLNI